MLPGLSTPGLGAAAVVIRVLDLGPPGDGGVWWDCCGDGCEAGSSSSGLLVSGALVILSY